MLICLCYSRETHYPTLEKPGFQNTVCENQSKQLELSDHWTSIKLLFFKKNNRGWHKKEKIRLTEIQVLTKDFTSYKVRYKSSRKKSNTVKPVNLYYL